MAYFFGPYCILNSDLIRGQDNPCATLQQSGEIVHVFVTGKTYRHPPQHSELPADVVQVLVRAISLNSGYTSKILVSYSANSYMPPSRQGLC